MIKNWTANEGNQNKGEKMSLTKEKVAAMVKVAERCGFDKDSVYSSIKMNKRLSKKANEISDKFWSK